MQPNAWRLRLIMLALLVLVSLSFLTAVPLPAQTIGGYGLTWSSFDGGGGTSNGGGYTLSGTIGQPDAGVSIGGGYTLTGGFWGLDPYSPIYLPLIIRN